MPDMITLRDLVNTFTEQELDMTVPFDFKNPTSETIEYVNTYNTYIANGDYQAAKEYRTAHADILEPMIHDATALNRQQAMMINTYLFAKGEKSASNTSYDNTETKIDADNLQDALDYIIQNLNNIKERLITGIVKIENKSNANENLLLQYDQISTYEKDGTITRIKLTDGKCYLQYYLNNNTYVGQMLLGEIKH